MNKKYVLTGTEELIMEILWNAEESMTVKVVETRREVSCNVYYAICTREQQMHKWTKKIVAEFYDNSIGKFVKLFIGEGKLSEKDADELRKLL